MNLAHEILYCLTLCLMVKLKMELTRAGKIGNGRCRTGKMGNREVPNWQNRKWRGVEPVKKEMERFRTGKIENEEVPNWKIGNLKVSKR